MDEFSVSFKILCDVLYLNMHLNIHTILKAGVWDRRYKYRISPIIGLRC